MREPFAAQRELKRLLTAYYRELASGDRPVAWCTSVGPAEVLRALGFEVYFPENHGALIGARRLGGRYIPVANQAGYAPDICAYLTADVGAHLMGESPLEAYGIEGPPPPAVLVYNTNQCREVQEWFSFYAERLGVPLVGIHTPRGLGELTPGLLGYLRTEWARAVAELEGVAGVRLDPDRLAGVVRASHRACELWQRFLDGNRHRPARHTFFDHVILMAPAVVLRGRPEAVAFYRRLLDEAAARGPALEAERLRLYWEGMPVWGKNRFLAEFFAGRGVAVVASTYCHSWTFDFSGDDPLEAMARAYTELFITRSERVKREALLAACRAFGVDGVVFHEAKTCPHNTNTRFGLPQRLEAEGGPPAVTVFGDLVDLRHFSEEAFTFRMEAFLERLGL